MHFVLDMCFALDMPCGARGIYIISSCKATYRICPKANISILRSKNIDKKKNIYGFLQQPNWLRSCTFCQHRRHELLRPPAGRTKAGNSRQSPLCPLRKGNVRPGRIPGKRHHVIMYGRLSAARFPLQKPLSCATIKEKGGGCYD